MTKSAEKIEKLFDEILQVLRETGIANGEEGVYRAALETTAEAQEIVLSIVNSIEGDEEV